MRDTTSIFCGASCVWLTTIHHSTIVIICYDGLFCSVLLSRLKAHGLHYYNGRYSWCDNTEPPWLMFEHRQQQLICC